MDTTRERVTHTPGEWTIENDNTPWTEGNAETAVEHGEEFGCVEELFSIMGGEEGDRRPICRLEWIPLGTDDEQNEIRANARLIAAAPDLLAACRMLAESPIPSTLLGQNKFLAQAADMAVAAIAKARGEA